MKSVDELTIDYILRNRPGAYSMERLFNAVREGMEEGIHIRWLTLPKPTLHFWDVLPNLRWARRQCGRLVHVTGDAQYCALLAGRSRVVLTIHDVGILETSAGWRRWLLKKLWFEWPMRRASLITCVSEKTRRDLLAMNYVPAEKIRVIPPPVDGRFQYRQKAFNEVCPRILHFNFTPNKNLSTTIKALEGVQCHLQIIGKPKEEQLDLLKRCRIHYSWQADLTDEAMLAEYEACDMLCFPSTYEGFGMPIIEAQAVGRAVVTSNVSPMAEVAGKGAWLADPNDVGSIRQAVMAVIQDGKNREAVIQAGLENARLYDARKIAAQYAEIYRQLTPIDTH